MRSKSIHPQYLALAELLKSAPAYECLDAACADPAECQVCGRRHRAWSKIGAAHHPDPRNVAWRLKHGIPAQMGSNINLRRFFTPGFGRTL